MEKTKLGVRRQGKTGRVGGLRNPVCTGRIVAPRFLVSKALLMFTSYPKLFLSSK